MSNSQNPNQQAVNLQALPITPELLEQGQRVFVLENFVYSEVIVVKVEERVGPYRETYVDFSFVDEAQIFHQPAKRYVFFRDELGCIDYLVTKCMNCIGTLQKRFEEISGSNKIIRLPGA